jgi:hypothetical protein
MRGQGDKTAPELLFVLKVHQTNSPKVLIFGNGLVADSVPCSAAI